MSSSEKKELFSGKTFDQMLGLDDAPPEGTPLELGQYRTQKRIVL